MESKMFSKLLTPSFIRELDDAYYAKFPEEWEQGDFFVDAPVYLSILAGETDRFARPRQNGEEVTAEYIMRAGRKVWKVGQVFSVRNARMEVSSETTQKDEGAFTDTYTISPAGTVVGRLKLVEIRPDSRWFGQKEDELIFEKVNTPS
jgi:hypothetical protein